MIAPRLLLAAALAAALGACSKTADPGFDAGTPTVAGLTLETTGGAFDGVAATSAAALTVEPAALATACAATPAAYEFTCQLRQAVVGVNRFVRAAVEPVEALVAAGATASPSAAVRVYGPAALPAASPVASFQLTVRFLGDETYRWKLEARPVDGGVFRVVMAGQLHVGDAPHRGRGFLGIDLDALGAVNPSAFTGKGRLLAAFAHAAGAKALVYAAQGFAADAGADPVSAIFTGWKDAAGRARVRLAAKGEYLLPSGGGADLGNELLLSRVRWWPAVGGRTAVAVLQGDVASYGAAGFDAKALVGLECFGAGVDVTYRALFVCGTVSGAGPECRVVPSWQHAVAAGADGLPLPGACSNGTDAFDPATLGLDPAAVELEAGAPVVPDAPPAVMPGY